MPVLRIDCCCALRNAVNPSMVKYSSQIKDVPRSPPIGNFSQEQRRAQAPAVLLRTLEIGFHVGSRGLLSYIQDSGHQVHSTSTALVPCVRPRSRVHRAIKSHGAQASPWDHLSGHRAVVAGSLLWFCLHAASLPVLEPCIIGSRSWHCSRTSLVCSKALDTT